MVPDSVPDSGRVRVRGPAQDLVQDLKDMLPHHRSATTASPQPPKTPSSCRDNESMTGGGMEYSSCSCGTDWWIAEPGLLGGHRRLPFTHRHWCCSGSGSRSVQDMLPTLAPPPPPFTAAETIATAATAAATEDVQPLRYGYRRHHHPPSQDLKLRRRRHPFASAQHYLDFSSPEPPAGRRAPARLRLRLRNLRDDAPERWHPSSNTGPRAANGCRLVLR